jgi:uncharacterized NAD(P)/FAD-binding protein YdhS
MNALAEDSEHFSRWIARHHGGEMKNAFQPRKRYGEYLTALLADARRGAPSSAFVARTADATKITSNDDGKIVIQMSLGEPIFADRVLLATGHRAPGVPEGLKGIQESPRFVADPWSLSKVRPIGDGERILVVGSGLTTVDFVMTRMRAGHRAPIDVISRHGLSPLGHPVRGEDFPLIFPFPDESVRGVVRSLREAAAVAGANWSGVVDRFRREIHRIWNGWDDHERGRFIRHVRAYWDIHRHRVAPEIYREWNLYVQAGKVRIEAARVKSAVENREEIRVVLERRGSGECEKIYDRVVNCTGAAPDLSLLEGRGYLRDPLRVGVPTDEIGRPLFTDGRADPHVFVLGPALRTRFWEMIAIPDLSGQAKVVVDAILDSRS